MARHAAVNFIRSPGRASTVLHPLRMRILRALREPGSAAQVARQLRLPRQRVNYHLRELEKEGLVELVEERRNGNCVERLLRATADSYLISPEALGDLAPEASDESDHHHPSYLVALAANAMRDLAALRAQARAPGGSPLTTFAAERAVDFASLEDWERFVEDIEQTIDRLIAKCDRGNGAERRSFRLILGGYSDTEPQRGQRR